MPATFMVLTTADSGADSFRQALLDANATPGPDVINFNIPGAGVQTIALLSALPTITDAVTIDGSTQSGFAGTPLIMLDGSALDSTNGLAVGTADCTIKSLAIGNFANAAGIVIGSFGGTGVMGNQVMGCYVGINADGATAAPNDTGIRVDNGASNNSLLQNVVSGNNSFGIVIGDAANNTVAGNIIGLDAAGASAVPNHRMGVFVVGGGHDNLIGGTTLAARNVISANVDFEIVIDGTGTDNNRVEGNFLGPDITGLAAPANNNGKPDAAGVSIADGAQNNTIGGTAAGAGNVISANNSNAISLFGTGTNRNQVQGNLIGTDATGSTALPNSGSGIRIGSSAQANLIGGTVAGAGNVISGNTSNGIDFENLDTDNNQVQGNIIGHQVQVDRLLDVHFRVRRGRVGQRQWLARFDRRFGHVSESDRQQPAGSVEVGRAGDGGGEVENLGVNSCSDIFVTGLVADHGISHESGFIPGSVPW